MVLQRKLRPSITRVNAQLDPRHAAIANITAPINHTRHSPRTLSPDGATRKNKLFLFSHENDLNTFVRHLISVCNKPLRSTQPSTLRRTVKWVPAKGQLCSAAGKLTAGLAESNDSLTRGEWLKSPAGWLSVHRDQHRAQRSVTSMESLYLYIRKASGMDSGSLMGNAHGLELQTREHHCRSHRRASRKNKQIVNKFWRKAASHGADFSRGHCNMTPTSPTAAVVLSWLRTPHQRLPTLFRGPDNSPKILPSGFLVQWSRSPSNTCFFSTHKSQSPNGISIGSAVFAQHIRVTITQTDRQIFNSCLSFRPLRPFVGFLLWARLSESVMFQVRVRVSVLKSKSEVGKII